MDLFHHIVEELVAERRAQRGDLPALDEIALTFNPELAPLDLLLQKASQYEALPTADHAKVRHHLEEIKVVLIKTMVSDQLSFIGVAKAWFTAADFEFIHTHRIGSGKIGGKAAGMLLAWKILQQAAPEVATRTAVPRSYFVGADVFYDFKAVNNLEYINQKYKSLEQIRAEYPDVVNTYVHGRFPEPIADRLRALLGEVGRAPLIVRSSSLLEDNFGTSFAGKYASYFCANQGTPRENLHDLTTAIRRVYASVSSPDALIYRRRMGLLDYDERMAILIQEVQGERHGRYFFPTLGGVAFRQSPLVWNSRLRREEGFVRMVLGLGTRAVERVAEDYPRLVFLSHPLLRPEVTPAAIEHYAQRLMDVIDVEANALVTVPAREVLNPDFFALRWVASLKDDDTLRPLRSLGPQVVPERLVLTFDALLKQTDFVPLLKSALTSLSEHYGFPVDVEFALTLRPDERDARPRLTLHLLQCRPQSSMRGGSQRPVPANVPAPDQVFLATRLVPEGLVSGVEYIVYVDPAAYDRLTPARRAEVARQVSRLNKALEGRSFILMGPGRWGSSNMQLGVPVAYADIYNARALVELSSARSGSAPDPSYGTHFFQDLVESQIYSLAVITGQGDDFVNQAFLDGAHNALPGFLPGADGCGDCLKVIHVPAERAGRRADLVMDGERALAFLAPHKGD
jgi:hypothetical protein